MTASLLVAGCVPVIEAPAWRAPVAVDDRLYRLALPRGFVDTCIGDEAARAKRSKSLAASSTLVGCVEPIDDAGPVAGVAGIITSRRGGAVPQADFERYKSAIHEQVLATRAEADGQARLAGGSRVLKVLGEGRAWLVQAVFAAPQGAAPRSGVVAAGLVGDRLFYLSLLSEKTEAVDFEALGDIAGTWVRQVIADNLVPGTSGRRPGG